MRIAFRILFSAGLLLLFAACGQGTGGTASVSDRDTFSASPGDTATSVTVPGDTQAVAMPEETRVKAAAGDERPVVLVYNFHVTNRCVSCVAIEDATTKTLDTYFAGEVKAGRIRRHILDVDDEANKKISEKYQAFGSGLFVTRLYKGKENTIDLTGDGFRFARNKEERFIEILKTQINEYLKP